METLQDFTSEISHGKNHKTILYVIGGVVAIIVVAYAVNKAQSQVVPAATLPTPSGGDTTGTTTTTTGTTDSTPSLDDQLAYQEKLATFNEGLSEQNATFGTQNTFTQLQNAASIAATTLAQQTASTEQIAGFNSDLNDKSTIVQTQNAEQQLAFNNQQSLALTAGQDKEALTNQQNIYNFLYGGFGSSTNANGGSYPTERGSPIPKNGSFAYPNGSSPTTSTGVDTTPDITTSLLQGGTFSAPTNRQDVINQTAQRVVNENAGLDLTKQAQTYNFQLQTQGAQDAFQLQTQAANNAQQTFNEQEQTRQEKSGQNAGLLGGVLADIGLAFL